jgi:predicted anti-sigma-YlaC factor YlaD
MTCDEYQLKISALLDGEVAAADSGEIFNHLGSCTECRLFWHNTLALNAQLEIAGTQEVQRMEVPQLPKNIPTASAWWNRPIQLRTYTVSLILCVLISLSFLAGRSRVFSTPETIYITKLPAVVVTSETQVTHIRTEGELQ